MGSGLGHRLPVELESVPRLAGAGAGGLGTLGTAATVGPAAAAATGVGAAGPPDVEPDVRHVGVLQQRDLDANLSYLASASMSGQKDNTALAAITFA